MTNIPNDYAITASLHVTVQREDLAHMLMVLSAGLPNMATHVEARWCLRRISTYGQWLDHGQKHQVILSLKHAMERMEFLPVQAPVAGTFLNEVADAILDMNNSWFTRKIKEDG